MENAIMKNKVFQKKFAPKHLSFNSFFPHKCAEVPLYFHVLTKDWTYSFLILCGTLIGINILPKNQPLEVGVI